MDKDELMQMVSVYSNNVEYAIRNSSADVATRKLAQEIADETCSVLAAIIDRLNY